MFQQPPRRGAGVGVVAGAPVLLLLPLVAAAAASAAAAAEDDDGKARMSAFARPTRWFGGTMWIDSVFF